MRTCCSRLSSVSDEMTRLFCLLGGCVQSFGGAPGHLGPEGGRQLGHALQVRHHAGLHDSAMEGP